MRLHGTSEDFMRLHNMLETSKDFMRLYETSKDFMISWNFMSEVTLFPPRLTKNKKFLENVFVY
jgi:hypothetical protein